MPKQKQNIPFEVELLPSQKKVAHLRLGPYDTPSLMTFARSYMSEHGRLFELNGFYFAHASTAEIDKLTEDHGLIEFKNWASKNYPGSGHYAKCGFEHPSQMAEYIRFKDGTWAVRTIYQWLTFDPRQGKGGIGYDPKGNGRLANHVRIELLKNFNQLGYDQFIELDASFSNAWRIAREKYRKILKASGKAEKLAEKEASKDHVERTKIRMAVLAQASNLRDKLEVFVKSVTDETMTVKQIGELYEELTDLGALNKTMKKVYGSKMAKK